MGSTSLDSLTEIQATLAIVFLLFPAKSKVHKKQTLFIAIMGCDQMGISKKSSSLVKIYDIQTSSV